VESGGWRWGGSGYLTAAWCESMFLIMVFRRSSLLIGVGSLGRRLVWWLEVGHVQVGLAGVVDAYLVSGTAIARAIAAYYLSVS